MYLILNTNSHTDLMKQASLAYILDHGLLDDFEFLFLAFTLLIIKPYLSGKYSLHLCRQR